MNISNKKRKKTKIIYYDIGLSFLRPFLSFLVIMEHCYTVQKTQGTWGRIYHNAARFNFHVPIFFLMSFYFSYKTIISRNYGKQLKRIERLLIIYFYLRIK
jgi:fucose 4-O-acetylase-like acetyltransferase